MGKKQVAVSLRKPPSVDREGAVSKIRSRIDELRPSFGDLRALTVHLPTELASRLLLRCMQEDRDVSNVISDLVRKHLEGKVEDPEITLAMLVRWIQTKVSRVTGFAASAASF